MASRWFPRTERFAQAARFGRPTAIAATITAGYFGLSRRPTKSYSVAGTNSIIPSIPPEESCSGQGTLNTR